MKDNTVIDKLMESPRIKSLGLKREVVEDILHTHDSIVLDTLLERGNISLQNGMIIEVVRLLDRVHVLRGVSYKSNKKYKLKLTMEDDLYEKIESYYDKLIEDIS